MGNQSESKGNFKSNKIISKHVICCYGVKVRDFDRDVKFWSGEWVSFGPFQPVYIKML